MNIAIDATALGSGRGGDETALRGMLIGLARVLPEHANLHFTLLTRPNAELPADVQQRARHFEVRRMPWGAAPLRYGLTVPRMLRERPVDLLYSITHAPPLSTTPVALQVHDLSFLHRPEFYPLKTRLRLNLLVPFHARQARIVMTGSELARRDLIRSYRLRPERVVVVPDAVEEPRRLPHLSSTQETQWLARLGLRPPFVLYVGNLHPRKNVARLIEAFVRGIRTEPPLADHQLAIVGGHWWRGGAEERVAQLAPQGRVVLTGRLPDDDRDRLLRAADMLAYPSLFEGFGLPPLEAMAVGTPVLASNTSTMPEILGDAALLVDPLDVQALASGLARLSSDTALRATLRERGFARVKRYDVRETGARALEAFALALGLDAVAGGAAAVDERSARRSIWTTETQSLSMPASSLTSPSRSQAALNQRASIDISEPWSRAYAMHDHRQK